MTTAPYTAVPDAAIEAAHRVLDDKACSLCFDHSPCGKHYAVIERTLVAQDRNSDADRQALELAGVVSSWPPEFQDAVDAAGECPPRWPL